MTFFVSIDQFEGPLDLMLHLIKEKQLDLFNLDTDQLIDQYIAFIHHMEEMHLEVAGEYLSELAGLVEYKSKALLPSKKDSDEGLLEEDPKDLLVRRLIEYQKFKDVAQMLSDRYEERNRQFAKALSLEADAWIQDYDLSDIKGNPYDLMKAMNRCLRHVALTMPLETRIAKNELTVEDIVARVKKKYGPRTDKFCFKELVEDCADVEEFIVTFLAVLDMIRRDVIIFDVSNEETIWLKWSEMNE